MFLLSEIVTSISAEKLRKNCGIKLPIPTFCHHSIQVGGLFISYMFLFLHLIKQHYITRYNIL